MWWFRRTGDSDGRVPDAATCASRSISSSATGQIHQLELGRPAKPRRSSGVSHGRSIGAASAALMPARPGLTLVATVRRRQRFSCAPLSESAIYALLGCRWARRSCRGTQPPCAAAAPPLGVLGGFCLSAGGLVCVCVCARARARERVCERERGGGMSQLWKSRK